MDDLIRFNDVTLAYGRKPVLSGLDFAIERGDFLGIVGPNGAGKTTILKAVLGTLRPRSGRIVHEPRLRYGYVPQRQVADEAYPLSVMDVVLMGRYGLLGPFRRPKRHDLEYALECLDHVGMAALSEASYRDLSGGQKQRVLIARALAAEPDVLVLDEPTNDMDLAGERSIMDLIGHLHDDHGMTVVVVSHILSVVINYVNRIGLLDGGFEIGSVEEMVTSEKLSRLYGARIEVGEVGGRKVAV